MGTHTKNVKTHTNSHKHVEGIPKIKLETLEKTLQELTSEQKSLFLHLKDVFRF